MYRKLIRNVGAFVEAGPRAMWITRGAKRRGAVQKTREFAALVAFLSKRDLCSVVEIGTLHGGTLWAWCQLARSDARIISVDLPGGEFGGGYEESAKVALRGYARRGQALTLIRGDSHDGNTLRRVRDALGDRVADLLFIDGDHAYLGVRNDFEMYSPLVGSRGVVVFHDIVAHPPDLGCQVDLFWREVREQWAHLEFTDPRDVRGRGQWGGIGVAFLGKTGAST